jgi:TonB family protein
MYLLIALLVGVLFGSVAHSQGAENFDEFTLRTPDRGVLTQDRVHPPHRDSSWERNLVEHLRRHKRYPSEALSRREEGTVLLSVSLDRNGHVLGHHIARSSGHVDLDKEVMDLIMRAEPLPAFPETMPQARLDITIPIRFSVGTNAVSGLEQFKPVDTAPDPPPNIELVPTSKPVDTTPNPSPNMGVISDSSPKKGDLGTCYSPWMIRQIKNINPEILEVDNGKIVGMELPAEGEYIDSKKLGSFPLALAPTGTHTDTQLHCVGFGLTKHGFHSFTWDLFILDSGRWYLSVEEIS